MRVLGQVPGRVWRRHSCRLPCSPSSVTSSHSPLSQTPSSLFRLPASIPVQIYLSNGPFSWLHGSYGSLQIWRLAPIGPPVPPTPPGIPSCSYPSPSLLHLPWYCVRAYAPPSIQNILSWVFHAGFSQETEHIQRECPSSEMSEHPGISACRHTVVAGGVSVLGAGLVLKHCPMVLLASGADTLVPPVYHKWLSHAPSGWKALAWLLELAFCLDRGAED